MPVYQYACTECGDQLEVRQSFSDDPLTECPACAGRLRKVLNAVGVVFKGSGFYRTDSRSDSGAKAGTSGTSGPSKSDSTSTPSSSPSSAGATSAGAAASPAS